MALFITQIMAEQNTTFVLKDGVFYRKHETWQEINLQADIITKFAGEISSKTGMIFNSAQVGTGLVGAVGMATKGKLVAFTLRIGILPIRARFLLRDGLLVPDFACSEHSIPFHFSWYVPSAMNLYLIVTMQAAKLVAGDQFLVAIDNQSRMYRLPTSNVYEDCRLCAGRFESSGTTYLDVLIKCWNQFQNSEWQADLAQHGGDNGQENAKRMFRFKPGEGDSFEQQDAPANWQSYAKKIANETIASLLVT